MKAKSKKLAAAAVTIVLMTFLVWLGGYNFDTRGKDEAVILLLCMFAVLMVYSFPGWKDDK